MESQPDRSFMDKVKLHFRVSLGRAGTELLGILTARSNVLALIFEIAISISESLKDT